MLNGNGWKPKGMQRNTLERLTAQHDTFIQTSLYGMDAKLNLLGNRLMTGLGPKGGLGDPPDN